MDLLEIVALGYITNMVLTLSWFVFLMVITAVKWSPEVVIASQKLKGTPSYEVWWAVLCPFASIIHVGSRLTLFAKCNFDLIKVAEELLKRRK